MGPFYLIYFCIKTEDGVEHALKYARYMSMARRNLNSLGELYANGYVDQVDREKVDYASQE
jgi:hypothetical protein